MDERIAKYFNGELSMEERLSLLREVQEDKETAKKFAAYQNTYALLNLGHQVENREIGKKKFSEFISRKHQESTRNQWKRWMSYAAVAALLIVSSSLITGWLMKTMLNTADTPAITYNTLITPAGQRAKLTLQDGTEVWLNAKSKLVYPSQFSGKERLVEVEGEAFFKVAKNPKQPFIVTSRQVDMKVLGTQFNVYSYPETGYVQTSLLEGSVYVYMPSQPNRGVYLKPDQQVTVENGKMRVERIPLKEHFLWTDGIYAFEKEPLISILKKMELYYEVQIIVEDATMFNETYTGKFRQRDSLDDVFKILQQIRKFRVKVNADRNIITLSK